MKIFAATTGLLFLYIDASLASCDLPTPAGSYYSYTCASEDFVYTCNTYYPEI
jgi:hypothetical protein